MTVSRALSGNKNVSEKTRKLILDHAIRTGYVKSSAASTMRGGPSAIIGLLLPNIINEFYARFANSLSSLCAEAGFDLVIHLTDDNYEQEIKSLRRLQALQARAVIRVPTPVQMSTSGQNHVTIQPSIPIIDFIRTRENEKSVGSLMIDDGVAIKTAAEHLITLGCDRIAYIGASENLSSGQQRLKAFTQTLKNTNIEIRRELICTGSPSYQMGYENMMSLLKLDKRPDGLVCGGFEISNGALDACLASEIKIPSDLYFIGYGDPSFYKWISGGISTISISEEDVAHRAIGMVKSLDTLDENKTEIVSTELLIRC